MANVRQIDGEVQSNLSFCVFHLETEEERLFWESRIISTLAHSAKPSVNWLGNHSPKEKIRASGLWQVNELYKDCLTKEEFEELKIILA